MITACSRRIAVTSVAISLALWNAPAVSPQEIGALRSISGDVTLIRDGTLIQRDQLRGEMAIMAGELIQTGYDGQTVIDLTPTIGSLTVKENSAVYLTKQASDTPHAPQLTTLSGWFSLQANTAPRLTIVTPYGEIYTQGADVDLIIAPNEAMFCGVRSGQVELSIYGERFSVSASSAIQLLPGQRPAVTAVGRDDFEPLYNRWQARQLSRFRSSAPSLVQAYARRYLDTRETFGEAYAQLIDFRQPLQEATGAPPSSLGNSIRLRARVSPAIIRMRSVFPIFESTVYRLQELWRFHDQGIGETPVGVQDSQTFFLQFEEQLPDISLRLSEVRHLFVLYRDLEQSSFGELPYSLTPTPFGDDAFFGTLDF